jgi:hypothetical protein
MSLLPAVIPPLNSLYPRIVVSGLVVPAASSFALALRILGLLLCIGPYWVRYPVLAYSLFVWC